MRRFVYCKVVLTTSLVWVLVDVFLLLYFSECNKCDNKKDHSLLPALRGESDCLTDHRVLLSTCMGCRCPLFILSTYCAPAIALWAACWQILPVCFGCLRCHVLQCIPNCSIFYFFLCLWGQMPTLQCIAKFECAKHKQHLRAMTTFSVNNDLTTG